jgi:hypothetical protein
MNILIACEESQRECLAFRAKGHRAFSCDLQECSGGHPSFHIVGDVLPLLNGDCDFQTQDGLHHIQVGRWDLIIAHPPCTYLSIAGQQCFSPKIKTYEEMYERSLQRSDAALFFVKFFLADCDRIAVENPVGYMNTHFEKPTQIIHPWQFCDTEDDPEFVTKKTCLWLKGLPPLKAVNAYPPPKNETYLRENDDWGNKYKYKVWAEKTAGAVNRSKTFRCVAKAMAEQWG